MYVKRKNSDGKSHIGVGRNIYRVLVWKPEVNRLLERPKRRWDYNIKMDFKVTGTWIGLFW
jgi:hypothetical protein